MNISTRAIVDEDAELIAGAFAAIGWNKPAAQYSRYCNEQAACARWVRIASVGDHFAGYVTVVLESRYPPFKSAQIPEIQDLNVLPKFRRLGVAGRLLNECEDWIASRSTILGIAVGLHPGYNAAQRLYVKRGYVPDGRGVTTHNRYVNEGELVLFDDELVIWMTKTLGNRRV